MELFLHPWSMIFGGILVSAPILIHLINRMRFKRLRWAAMEFLLKSQKRNRRKLIIEQLILLLLRILLVLLAAFLVARFVGAKTRTDEGTTHAILIDDTLSMTDGHKPPDGTGRVTAFDTAKKEILELAKTLSRAPTPQHLHILKLSDMENPVFDNPLKASTLQEMERALDGLKPSAMHINPEVGINGCEMYLKSVAKGTKVAHVFSDFRENDWVTGAGATQLAEAVDKLLALGININMVDVAHQFRKEAGGQHAASHDNLAIVDLHAESRVVAEQVPVDFVVEIENYGLLAKPSFLHVKVNGTEDLGATQPIQVLPAMARTPIKFSLLFSKTKPSTPIAEKDTIADRDRKRRADREFQVVSVEIQDDEGGVQGDNVRDMIIEVRHKVPILIIDGNDPAFAQQPGNDADHLREAFKAARAYEVEWRPLDKIDDKIELDLYPTIFLCNVGRIKDVGNSKAETILQKLDTYVKNGGSVVFCMGDRIEANWYNTVLHTQYKGLFPVKIAGNPTEPLDEKQRELAKFEDPQPKLLLPKLDKEFSEVLRGLEAQFRYLIIDRYYPTLDRSQWEKGTENATTLVYLARRREARVFEEIAQQAQRLMEDAGKQVSELADQESEYRKYVPLIEPRDGYYRSQVMAALRTPYLYNLVKAIDLMLRDPGVKDDPNRPNMLDLWAHRKMKRVAKELEQLREKALYGDPLVVSNMHGKGRTVAFLTTAGTWSDDKHAKWNEWGGGSPVSFTYEVFMMDLQRYLIGESESLNRIVGTESVELTFDSTLYEPGVKVRFRPQRVTPPRDETKPAGEEAPKKEVGDGMQDLKAVSMTEQDGLLTFRFSEFKEPGIYYFDFKPLPGAGDKAIAQTRAFALNVDAARESDLKRAATQKLERGRNGKDGKAKIEVRSPGQTIEEAKAKEPDMSETPWLYLLFLIILVIEQALAVHLSFHLKGNEGAPPVAAPRARAEAA
jgi:hypothetical protein